MRRVDRLRLRDQDDAVIGGIPQRTVGGFFLKDIRHGGMDNLRIQHAGLLIQDHQYA